MALTVSDETLAHYRALIPPMDVIAATDPLIVPTLEKINSCKDIVTLYSCQGHFNDDEDGGPDYTYILMIANEAGREKLYRLLEALADISGHYKWSITLDYSCKKDSDIDFLDLDMVDWDNTYPTLALRYHGYITEDDDVKAVKIINNELLKAVEVVFG